MASPSIVPGSDTDVYVVLDDFGQLGRAYREVDEEKADRESVIRSLKDGQYNRPVRIVCFNTADGSARDVPNDNALGLRHRAARSGHSLSPRPAGFVYRDLGRGQAPLRHSGFRHRPGRA